MIYSSQLHTIDGVKIVSKIENDVVIVMNFSSQIHIINTVMIATTMMEKVVLMNAKNVTTTPRLRITDGVKIALHLRDDVRIAKKCFTQSEIISIVMIVSMVEG